MRKTIMLKRLVKGGESNKCSKSIPGDWVDKPETEMVIGLKADEIGVIAESPFIAQLFNISMSMHG